MSDPDSGSGFDWIPLRRLISEPMLYGANESGDRTEPTDPRYVRITDVAQDGSLRADTFRSLPEELAKPYILNSGDVLLARSGATVGKSFLYRESWGRCCFAGYMIRARCDRRKLDPRFLSYYLSSSVYWNWVRSNEIQATIQNLSAEKYAGLRVPLLPISRQHAIADFLDRETAKIDALTEAQRRLVELLKEKCQAVVSYAVTKGLNSNARMKPSGTEWLGDVPEGWAVLPLKRIVAIPITDGPHETPQFVDDGVPFVSAEAVSSGRIDFSKVRACISQEDNLRYSKKYSPEINDIYMVKSGATTGVTAIVEHRTDFNIWSPLAVIRCSSESIPRFVLHFMRSRQFLDAISLYWSYGTQQNIGMGVIENLACTVPPIAEQAAIVDFLGAEIARHETLMSGAQRVIDLLAERRSALITAAVTGQIEVATNIAAEAAA